MRPFLSVVPFAGAGGVVTLEAAAPPPCAEGHAPSVTVRVSAAVGPVLSPVVCAASLLALVSAVMQHWGETEVESVVVALHSPEMEGCFAVAELCFSCAARHCCSSELRFSADFSGVSVAEKLFSAVALSFFSK